jgi:hypothetical protein
MVNESMDKKQSRWDSMGFMGLMVIPSGMDHDGCGFFRSWEHH